MWDGWGVWVVVSVVLGTLARWTVGFDLAELEEFSLKAFRSNAG